MTKPPKEKACWLVFQEWIFSVLLLLDLLVSGSAQHTPNPRVTMDESPSVTKKISNKNTAAVRYLPFLPQSYFSEVICWVPPIVRMFQIQPFSNFTTMIWEDFKFVKSTSTHKFLQISGSHFVRVPLVDPPKKCGGEIFSAWTSGPWNFFAVKKRQVFPTLRILGPSNGGVGTCIAGVRVLTIGTFEGSGFLGYETCDPRKFQV